MYLKLDESKWYRHTQEWSDRTKGTGKVEVYKGQIEVVEDVAPVVHAHWVDEIPSGYDAFSCSHCHLGKRFHVPPNSAYLFCPWCGAKMDEAVE